MMCVAFYKKYYVASNATVVLVGNVDRKQAEEIVKSVVSALPTGEKPAALPKVNSSPKPKKSSSITRQHRPISSSASRERNAAIKIISPCMLLTIPLAAVVLPRDWLT